MGALSVAAPLLFAARPAQAASCCGTGPSAVEKLGSAEAASLSLAVSGLRTTGGWDSAGAWGGGTGGRELRLELTFAFAVTERLQLGVALPTQYAWREVDTIEGQGGGVGDLSVSGRFDPLPRGLSQAWPALGLTLAVLVPTGRAEFDAQEPLAADATGQGGFELRPGLALDGDLGPLTWALSSSVGLREETDAGGRRLQRPPGFALYGFAGCWFGPVLAGGAIARTWEGAPAIDGRAVEGAERARTTGSLLGAWELTAAWSVVAEARADLPWSGAGRNEPGGFGGRIALRRALLSVGAGS